MTTPRIVRFDWERFHARVERLRAEQNARTQAQAVQASLDAFRRWGVAPPSSFRQELAAVAAGRGATDQPQGNHDNEHF